jgi:DNA modification methylase
MRGEKTISTSGMLKVLQAERIAEQRSIMASSVKDILPSDRWHIWQADMRYWRAQQQYDFIITDPPYPKEYLYLYEILADRAKEWLKPEGLLIAMCGQSYLNEIMETMCEHVTYYWTAAYLTPGQPTPLRQRQVNTTWKPLLIFSIADYKGKIFGDVFKSDGNDKSLHEWGQSVSGMYDIVSKICLPGQTILDPFCGAGTTGIAALKHGCLFDGIDLEQETVDIAKGRLAEYDATAQR